MNFKNLATAFMVALSITTTAFAHDGKRTEIVVVDNQIYGQGYLFATNGNPANDFGGTTRPYYNAIHSHFEPVPLTDNVLSNITGFDLSDASPFEGFDLVLTLTGAGQWANAPAQDGTMINQDFGTPQLSPLSAGENINVFFGSQPGISTDSPGSFTLIESVSGPVTDIDLNPIINFDPSATLRYLQWQLSAPGSGLIPSASLYTILSPAGDNPVDKMHFQSLALERSLGIQAAVVPEPGTLALLGIGSIAAFARRKRS